MKSPGTPSAQQSRDIFGAEFKGTPSHHRVLKPPGGGTSDIFGTNAPGGAQAAGSQNDVARRIKNHMASSVFLSDEPASQQHQASSATHNGGSTTDITPSTPPTPIIKNTNKQSGNNSFCRLFGPPSPPKLSTSALKSNPQFQSNILPNERSNVVADQTNGNQNDHMNGGDNTDSGHHQPMTNGNTSPVLTNGNRNNTSTTLNGSSNNGSSNPRARVPPGGFSSGLW